MLQLGALALPALPTLWIRNISADLASVPRSARRSRASCRDTDSIRAGLKPVGGKPTILEQMGHNRASFYQISTLHVVAQIWLSES